MNRYCTVLALLIALVASQGGMAQQQSTAQSRDLLRSFNPTGSLPNAVAVDPRTNIVYVGGRNRVTLHAAKTGVMLASFDNACTSWGADSEIQDLTVLESALFISCKNDVNRSGSTVDLKSGAPIAGMLYSDMIGFALDGQVGAEFSRSNRDLRVFKPGSQRMFSYGSVPNSRPPLVFSNDGQTLAAAEDGGILLINMANITALARLPVAGRIERVEFSNDGQILAVATTTSVTAYRLPNLTPLINFPLTTPPVFASARLYFGADDDLLLYSSLVGGNSSGVPKTIALSLSSGQTLYELQSSTRGVTNDGRYLITQGSNGVSVFGNDSKNAWLRESIEVLVNVNVPNAVITVDGKTPTSAASSPNELQLYPGRYELSVSAPGYRPRVQQITVATAQPLSLNVALEPMRGSVRFDSQPRGASVTLDGKNIGVTPVTVPDLALGQHQYRIELSDHRGISSALTIADETPVPITATLSELPGLSFSSVPSGATIELDGVVRGVTPLTLRDLKPGRVGFTAKLAGFQDFTGRATVPDTGKGKVEITLSKATTFASPGAVEAGKLQFNAAALTAARAALIRVNDTVMLPAATLAALTGLGVYGDTTRVTLASGLRELTIAPGNPTRKDARLYVSNNIVYVPLSGLEGFDLKLIPAATIVLALGDDRVDLGKPNAVFATETVVAPLRNPWRSALERSIVLDGAPAFAVRDLLKFVKGLEYEPETLSLLLNKKVVLRAFQPIKGSPSSLVIYQGSAYLPSRLLGAIGVSASFTAPLLTMTVSEITFDLRFAPAGRAVTTTAALTKALTKAQDNARAQIEIERKAEIARYARLQTRERVRIDGITALLFRYHATDFRYLGNNIWGSAQTLRYAKPQTLVMIVIAGSGAVSTWRTCEWRSRDSLSVTRVYMAYGRLAVELSDGSSRVIALFEYQNQTCRIAAVY